MDEPRGDARDRLELMSVIRTLTVGMPFTALLFALSLISVSFGTVSDNGGVLILGLVVGSVAMLSGMFLE